MLDRTQKILSTLGLVSIFAATGAVQAGSESDLAEGHTLNLNHEERNESRYQANRQENDFVAVMPATEHQAETLSLQQADRGYQEPEQISVEPEWSDV